MYSFLFIVEVYNKTASGALCSELRVVDDLTTCKKAAEALGYQLKTKEDEAGWPRWCYVSGRVVFFNQHVNGSANINAAQICKGQGKGLRFFLTYIRFFRTLHKTISQERFLYFTDPCVPNPCYNDGICNNDPNSGNFKCQCTDGWVGDTCDIGITLLHKNKTNHHLHIFSPLL